MQRKLVVIAHVPNEAVTDGFVPAGKALEYDVILITDHALEYGIFFKRKLDTAPSSIFECDVFNPIAIIDLLHAHGIVPDVVFSNSDHLQSASALVAEYFRLPGKQWSTCYRAKNKAAMRQYLELLGLPTTWSQLLQAGAELPRDINYPVIAKPCEGVASIDVSLCYNHQELEDYCRLFFRKNAGAAILLEGFLEGTLLTLETLGDGKCIQAVGGFDVALSEPPYFVELEAQWNGEESVKWREEALAQIEKFGVGFGVCHSEFIATEKGPILVEINYRSIGDGREFLLNKLLAFNWFETIIRLHAGQPLNEFPHSDSDAIIRYIAATSSGFVDNISNDLSREGDGVKLSFRKLKQAGDLIQISHSNKDYLGIVTGISSNTHKLKLSEEVDNFTQQLTWEVRK
jgi:predicted ATP-grasp superfamily ATP-dependent carboligase